jgi:hypothetical protein
MRFPPKVLVMPKPGAGLQPTNRSITKQQLHDNALPRAFLMKYDYGGS